MKSILCTIIITFLIAINCYSQNKHDNVIIIHGYIPYNTMRTVLFNNGLIPDNTDTTFISTKGISRSNTWICDYAAMRTDTATILKGFMSMTFDGTNTGRDQIENYGMKGSPSKEAFDFMDKIARSFNLPVSYARISR